MKNGFHQPLEGLMTTDIKRQRYQFDLAALQRLAALNYASLEGVAAQLQPSQKLKIALHDQLSFIVSKETEARYTSDVKIQQSTLTQALPGLRAAELEVRLYHDVQLAEVLRVQGVERLQAVYPQPNDAMHQSNEKYQANAFLQEWLQLIRKGATAEVIGR